MEALLSKDVLLSLFVLSIAGFVGSLIAIPFILVRLPAQYFDERHPRTWMEDHHPIMRWTGLIVKNVIGVVFLLAGFAMLFLPGQGILTMLIGVSLMDFPGKRRLERKLIGRPAVLETINLVRAKFDKPPLTVAEDP
ncbi:MAG: PGPGW domain-containing protein [Nitrospiraceae bacterium]